jgi:hypothetical protein
MKAISLGWGVQSFTLAAMVALGELEPVDVAIHADTTHERSDTYAFAAKWTPWLQEHGVRVVTVYPKHNDPVDNGYGWPDEPFYAINLDGSNGQIKRQCTTQWKIAPMRRWLQANRGRQPIEQWIGISLDEYQRMKNSNVKYITNRWPLIEKRMTRRDCALWLERHGLEVPPKSSCIFCPYHDTRSWQELKANGNGDWTKAVEVDRAIRKARPPYDLFVHPSRIPLEEVDLRTPQDKGQLSLWDEECSGICGV